MTITIQSATVHDYQDFVSIFSLVEETHREALPRKYQKPEILFTQEEFLSLIQDQATKIFMAKDWDLNIGFILVFKKQALQKPVLRKREYIEVDTLCISPSHRKQWIGKLLLDEVEKRAQENNINDIQLTVWDFNKEAKAFYEKNGYQTINCLMRKSNFKS